MDADRTPEGHEPGEERLRSLLAGTETPGRIDTGSIIRRSRRRRRARALAATSVGALAVVGIAAAVVGDIRMPVLQTASESADAGADSLGEGSSIFETEVDGADMGGQAPDALSTPVPVEALNPCGSRPIDATAAVGALAMTPRFSDTADAGGSTVEGTVVLRNDGRERVRGTIVSGPALTVSRDQSTVWHSREPSPHVGTTIDLAPGESVLLDAEIRLDECAEADERGQAPHPDPEPLPPGDYRVTAVLQLAQSAADDEQLTLIVSEPHHLTLR